MPRPVHRLTAPLALALAACGSAVATPANPDLSIHGVDVVIRTDAPFAASPDFAARVETTLEAALAYWGGSWDRLDGVTITFESAPHVACGGISSAIGCYDGDIRVTTLDAGVEAACVEQTALAHELGHAVIGDPSHRDPRWMDFEDLALRLEGRPGYGSAGETACPIYPSVWRHPPPPDDG
jgi:hypothetical protein